MPDLHDENIINQALSLHKEGHFNEAGKLYQKILAAEPHNFDATRLLGVLFGQNDRFPEAVDWFRKALEIQPGSAVTWDNLGTALINSGRHPEAEPAYRSAISIEPANAVFYLHLGNALLGQDKFDDAETQFRQSLTLDQENATAWLNLAIVQKETNRLQDTLDSLHRCLSIEPNFARARYNLGYLQLLSGDFNSGWPHYEWRTSESRFSISQHPSPRWSGESLINKSILLLAEQGMGDTILAMRYIRQLTQLGARIIVECQAPLSSLSSAFSGVHQFVVRGAKLPGADYHLPIMSLPYLLSEDLKTVFSPYLEPNHEIIATWSARLSNLGGFRIGIAWQGNANLDKDRFRSFPLHCFQSLNDLQGVNLISLQKGEPGVNQIAAFKKTGKLFDIDQELGVDRSFLDTAAIVANLDLVITSCTSVANLAGAMGTPTWVVLQQVPDWRWMLDVDYSPWYPHARLFRQSERGNWDEVFQRIRAQLTRVAQGAEPVVASLGPGTWNDRHTRGTP